MRLRFFKSEYEKKLLRGHEANVREFNRVSTIKSWHKKFAWFPINVGTHDKSDYRWFEFVYRKGIYEVRKSEEWFSYWEYKSFERWDIDF